VIGDQFLGSADSDDFPVPEERDAVGQPLDLVHRVTREEDGRSAARESLYQSVDRSPAGRVDPRGRLVKEEEVGVVDDGGGDAGPALLPPESVSYHTSASSAIPTSRRTDSASRAAS